jgi:hypothetical protein
MKDELSNDYISGALLREFYGEFGERFDEIWALLNRWNTKLIASEYRKNDVAIRLGEIVALNKRRYDPVAFASHQSKRAFPDRRVGGFLF